MAAKKNTSSDKPADLGKFNSVSDAILATYDEPGTVRPVESDNERVRTATQESVVDHAVHSGTEQAFVQDDIKNVELKVKNPKR